MRYFEAPGFAWLEQDGRHIATALRPSRLTRWLMKHRPGIAILLMRRQG